MTAPSPHRGSGLGTRRACAGVADRFALGALHGVAEDAAGAEEEGHGVEIGAKLLLGDLGDILGERVEME